MDRNEHETRADRVSEAHQCCDREGVKFHIEPGVHEAIAGVVADRHISDISDPAMHWSLISIYWVFLTADEHFCRHHVVLPLRMLLPEPGERLKAWEGKERPSGWGKSGLVPDKGILDVVLLEDGERYIPNWSEHRLGLTAYQDEWGSVFRVRLDVHDPRLFYVKHLSVGYFLPYARLLWHPASTRIGDQWEVQDLPYCQITILSRGADAHPGTLHRDIAPSPIRVEYP